mmetsp:Transcript_18398/g.44351  ORF Transcript_18398/g.44351 Transcript_18398/m.44351 type:complete len:213 (+) Transcript_18398:592-1230(+)
MDSVKLETLGCQLLAHGTVNLLNSTCTTKHALSTFIHWVVHEKIDAHLFVAAKPKNGSRLWLVHATRCERVASGDVHICHYPALICSVVIFDFELCFDCAMAIADSRGHPKPFLMHMKPRIHDGDRSVLQHGLRSFRRAVQRVLHKLRFNTCGLDQIAVHAHKLVSQLQHSRTFFPGCLSEIHNDTRCVNNAGKLFGVVIVDLHTNAIVRPS